MDQRQFRQIAKQLALTIQQRQEICRILEEDDYSAPFPLKGPVTFAKVLLLIQVIEDAGIRLDTALPVAISLSDTCDGSINPANLKRSCLRRLSSGKDLHVKIDQLYVSKDNSLGPFCDQLNIDKKWLEDAHQEMIEPDLKVCNGVILELYAYLKRKHAKNWSVAQSWMSRLYPGCDAPQTQTLSTDWKRLQTKITNRGNKAIRNALRAEEYKFPQVAPHTKAQESNVSLPNEEPSTSSLQPDLYHADYDSPIKKQLVQHIHQQDELIADLQMQLLEEQNKLSSIKFEYDNILDRVSDVKKDKNILSHQLKLLKIREESLLSHIKDLSEKFSPQKVKKQLQYRENKLTNCKESAENYKKELLQEREKVEELTKSLQTAKHKKRNEQKRVYYYRAKAKPLENRQDEEIRQLLRESKDLRLENDNLQCQLEECLNDRTVQTFQDGRYVDAIRLVCYDFIARNVGTQHISYLIRSVLENMAGVKVDRLPKATVVKLMALEADILARKQAARALLSAENATLHTDATSKKDRHFFSFQFSTESGNYSGGFVETVGGDTSTQLDITKDILIEMGHLISPEDIDRDKRPTEYQLLFNIKNTMTDRGPTSKGWVEGLEIWRENILKENVLPNYDNLSETSIKKLASLNDFYCGKHFLLGLAERTRIGLSLWEDEVVGMTGRIGMEELPEFEKWNCSKPSGLRLVRTACELVGPGAKAPHGVPSLFEDLLPLTQKNQIPTFEHNRFNIVFKAASAVFHHHHTLKELLLNLGSENKLHKAVLADIDDVVSLAQIRAIGLLEKHVSTPLSTITSRKEHILDLRKYYLRLKTFLTDMALSALPIMDGTAILFDDCPPIKDVVWKSLYAVRSSEEDALVEQIVSVLCASFLITVERQLFDYLGGKWSSPSDAIREQAINVPRNNDISERDFSGLDRLLRIKGTAKLEFISGMMLYTNNKTGEALRKMSAEQLHCEFDGVVSLARKSLHAAKERRAKLKRQRLEVLESKKKKKEKQAANRVRLVQKSVDAIGVDGQMKDRDEVEALLSKYTTDKEKKDALRRQLNFYKTLKIKGVPHTRFYVTSGGEELDIETLKENLLWVINKWATVMSSSGQSTPTAIEKKQLSLSDINCQTQKISHLKRKLVNQAEDERVKKVKSSSSKEIPFPGDGIIGQVIKHKYKVVTKSGKHDIKWYKGTVVRKANEEEMKDASEEDLASGCTIFMVHYEKHEHAEAIAIQPDWDNGDIKIIG